jgi:hypothetical protein
MGDLTPFQNQVLDAAARKEAEEKERKREEARNQHDTNRPRNSRADSGGSPNKSGMGQEETVRYVNKELNPDHEVHNND